MARPQAEGPGTPIAAVQTVIIAMLPGSGLGASGEPARAQREMIEGARQAVARWSSALGPEDSEFVRSSSPMRP
jgi:hypothetical protein